MLHPTLLPTPTHPDAQALARRFAETAVERDARGGTPKAERDALRDSGLLSLSIPVDYGGQGANWVETLDTVREFASVDSSIAHVYGFHHLLLATVRLFARPDQWEPWFEQTAGRNWFWGNALNPLDDRTRVRRIDHWYEFSGKKSFCSGALDSEMLIASGLDDSSGKLLIAAVPICVIALFAGDHHYFMPTLTTVVAVSYITLVPMVIGNICWFRIVDLLPANVAGLSAILVPIVAMISGAVVLDEPLGPLQWLAMVMSTTAITIAMQSQRHRRPGGNGRHADR